jgi:hypothetical protein
MQIARLQIEARALVRQVLNLCLEEDEIHLSRNRAIIPKHFVLI